MLDVCMSCFLFCSQLYGYYMLYLTYSDSTGVFVGSQKMYAIGRYSL